MVCDWRRRVSFISCRVGYTIPNCRQCGPRISNVFCDFVWTDSENIQPKICTVWYARAEARSRRLAGAETQRKTLFSAWTPVIQILIELPASSMCGIKIRISCHRAHIDAAMPKNGEHCVWEPCTCLNARTEKFRWKCLALFVRGRKIKKREKWENCDHVYIPGSIVDERQFAEIVAFFQSGHSSFAVDDNVYAAFQ